MIKNNIIKSYGGYKDSAFYWEAGTLILAFIIQSFFFDINYLLCFGVLIALFIIFFSTRLLDEVIFFEHFVLIIVRHRFQREKRKISYDQINKVIYFGGPHRDFVNLKIQYNYSEKMYFVKISYNYYTDKEKILDILKNKGISVELRGYPL